MINIKLDKLTVNVRSGDSLLCKELGLHKDCLKQSRHTAFDMHQCEVVLPQHSGESRGGPGVQGFSPFDHLM